jgi:hypothetical protein
MGYTFFDFIKEFILSNLYITAVVTLFVCPLWIFRKSKEQWVLWVVIFASALMSSYAGKAKVGGVNNAVMPTFVIFSLFLGMGIAQILQFLRTESSRHHTIAEVFFCVLALLQFTQLVYNPLLSIPPAEEYQIASKALKLVKKYDGNVYVPNSSIALMAGKIAFAHPYAIWDVLHTQGASQEKEILKNDLRKAVQSRLFDAIFIMPSFDYFPDLNKYYAIDESKYILMDDNMEERADIYIPRRP